MSVIFQSYIFCPTFSWPASAIVPASFYTYFDTVRRAVKKTTMSPYTTYIWLYKVAQKSRPLYRINNKSC